MNAVERIEHSNERRSAQAACLAVVHAIQRNFRAVFTAEDADNWKDAFELALVGAHDKPIYSAEQIKLGWVSLIAAWRKRDWPKPAEVAEFCAKVATERRQAKAVEEPKALEWRCEARLCIDRILPANEILGLPAVPAYTAKLWRHDGKRWVSLEVACGHSMAWRAEQKAAGWRPFTELTRAQQIDAHGGLYRGLPGSLGANLADSMA